MIDRLTARAAVRLTATALAVALLVVLPRSAGDYGLLIAFEIAQLAALAQAWNILAGFGGVVSLAVSAFVGVGSYVTGGLALWAGLGPYPSILAGGVFAACFALLVAVPMFRFHGLYFTVGSLVLAEALAVFMSNYNGLGGNQGLSLTGAAPTAATVYLLSLTVAVGATLAVAWISRGRLGLGLMAIRDDEDVAARVGVGAFRTKLVAFVVSSFLMGLVGGIQAQRTGYIEPSGAFTLSWSIETINAAIIGGVGTIAGPLIGAAISVGLSERLARYPEVHLAILGVLLILIIRRAPDGVWGAATRLLRARKGPAPVPTPAPVSASVSAPAHATGPAPDRWAPDLGAVAPADSASARERTPIRPGTVLLRAVGAGRTFGGVRAVDGVDLELRAGEVLGMVGPNGAGKSTLIGLLSGALKGDGRVELCGADVTALGPRARARGGDRAYTPGASSVRADDRPGEPARGPAARCPISPPRGPDRMRADPEPVRAARPRGHPGRGAGTAEPQAAGTRSGAGGPATDPAAGRDRRRAGRDRVA